LEVLVIELRAVGDLALELLNGERERGTLRSGSSGKRVTRPNQAIAIGLSEARRAGGKVPQAKRSTSSKKK
jgi:hypothetical protein